MDNLKMNGWKCIKGKCSKIRKSKIVEYLNRIDRPMKARTIDATSTLYINQQP